MENQSSKFLSGLLVGVAVGVALGLLFAPDSGENTRDKLKKKISDLKQKYNDEFGPLQDEDEQFATKENAD